MDEAIDAAHGEELRVVLILNSQVQCRKIVEQIRLKNPNAVAAVQGDFWVVSFVGMPHASITLYPMYNPPVGSYSKDEETAHWDRIRGNEFHKGNPRAFGSPVGPYIRLALP